MSSDRFGYRVLCRYRPGGATDRLEHRVRHLEYMIVWLPATIFGGAILAEDGEPLGMEVVLSVESRAEAERFVAGEPYCVAGIFRTVEIERVRIMTPPDDGGPLFRALAG